MNSVNKPSTLDARRTPSPDYDTARSLLEEKLRALLREIESYPAPIPACDLQFNTLLEERDHITEELRKLAASRE
ncbi:MAG: hypothetical protein OEW39_07085 [Deltaproteobacteria bacterium]|nr:hypothetical protein [Deltaproteobacteria bacterium]